MSDISISEKGGALIFTIIGVIVAAAAIGLLLAFPIKWTWNATFPQLFGLAKISWGQAWCLHFLAGCFIKSSLTKSET